MAKARRRCSEAFIVQGAWWEPANSDQQLTGAFTWSPDSGGELDVLGFFHDDSGTLGDWRADVLHGVAEGDEFTLINCGEIGSTLPSAGVNRQRIRANDGVLAGALIPDVGQLVFDRVTVELDYLAELSGRSTLERHIEWTDDRHVERVWIEYEQPREVVADMAHESVRLASEAQFGGGLGHAEIIETVVFSVDVREPLPLREIVGRYVPRLRDLVTLAAQRPSAIRSVRVAGPATTETRDDGRVLKRSAEFLAPFLPTPKDPAQVKRLTEALILLPADDRSFRTLIRRWFELAERLGPVLDLRFAPGYASFVYAESRFLNAVQAIEALHRRVLPNDPDPTDLEAREAAIASCPPQYKEWLKDELKYAHEPSLRRRLREVLRFVGPGLRPLTGKPSTFIHRVWTMRNALTHWDDKSTAYDGADLTRLATALNFLIDAALLRLLGSEQEQITAALAANSRFQFEVQRRSQGSRDDR
jgi:ApeA N-terminal domain 1